MALIGLGICILKLLYYCPFCISEMRFHPFAAATVASNRLGAKRSLYKSETNRWAGKQPRFFHSFIRWPGNQALDINSFTMTPENKERFRSFPGSAILEKAFCGSIDTTDPSEYQDQNALQRIMKKADIMCVKPEVPLEENGDYDEHTSLFARALVSEVTDNPRTMKQTDMAKRELALMKAQKAAASSDRKIGAEGAPAYLNSLAYALTGDDVTPNLCVHPGETKNGHSSSVLASGPFSNRGGEEDSLMSTSPFTITLGLCLSRQAADGHPKTVTRQSAFDFNELQDRQHKFVSSTDALGWRAGGGERGDSKVEEDTSFNPGVQSPRPQTVPSPDMAHIPIIQIDCKSEQDINRVIHALGSGELFIPHMSVLPESLSVNGESPPDLEVRFGCERNEDTEPDTWANWTLEFMHNQLYEYFSTVGARWTKRPFSVTLARKVRWKTVKHMNKYFEQSEKVIEAWRARGPQSLKPSLPNHSDGSVPEEMKNPFGLYLFRKGVPTNYFAPNFEPPYTTTMTRSLLLSVLNKSWDTKRQEWASDPVPRIVTPGTLLSVACGCTDPNAGGYVASEATKLAIENRKSEEKKVDSPGDYEEIMSKKKSFTDNAQSDVGQHSTAASAYAQSLVSGTTVMHANKTPPRLGSDKDWDEAAMAAFSSTHKKGTVGADPKGKRTVASKSNKKKGDDASAMSMQYSADGSTIFTREESTVLGQNFAKMSVSDSSTSKRNEDEFSMQESMDESVLSVVPTDEELFAFGWAKALDPASGNYYYYTLDRTKTVWDNPLSAARSS